MGYILHQSLVAWASSLRLCARAGAALKPWGPSGRGRLWPGAGLYTVREDAENRMVTKPLAIMDNTQLAQRHSGQAEEHVQHEIQSASVPNKGGGSISSYITTKTFQCYLLQEIEL